MKRKEVLRRLEERLARGEISEKTYLSIKARYESEPEEPEVPLEGTIEETVARVQEQAARVADEAVRAAGETFRSVEFSGLGVRLSDEAVKIAGAGVVSGNPVKTRAFKAAGSARVQGNLESDEAKVAGSCVFEGDVRTGEFRSSGSSHVAGSLRAREIDASGSLRVGKDVEADEITASGSLQVDGQVTAREFVSSGSVRIGGTLKADEVTIELGGTSSVRAIEADEVRVKVTGGFFRSRGELSAERVVGDEVTLEGTTADFVKGREVRVGPHCRIRVAEAKDLVVHESSEVVERRVPGA